MKKKIALLLAAVLAMTLCACSGGQTQSPSPTPSESTPDAPSPSAAAPTEGVQDVDYTLRVGQMGTGIMAAMVVLAPELGYYEE